MVHDSDGNRELQARMRLRDVISAFLDAGDHLASAVEDAVNEDAKFSCDNLNDQDDPNIRSLYEIDHIKQLYDTLE